MQSFELQTFTVNSGDSVSGQMGFGAGRSILAIAPALTSCQAFIDVSPTSGGPWTRASKTDGSSHFVWLVANGSAALVLNPIVVPSPYGRLSLSVAQTAPRSFQLLVAR